MPSGFLPLFEALRSSCRVRAAARRATLKGETLIVMRPLLTLLLALVALAPASRARELLHTVVHPLNELPAFHSTVPGDWSHSVDAHGNLQLANEGRTATFSLGLAHSANPRDALDTLARAILADAVAAPWTSREPAEISGHRGTRYVSRVRAANGTELRAELILVVVGDDHIASCSMLLAERINRTDETLARLVFGNIKLLPSH